MVQRQTKPQKPYTGTRGARIPDQKRMEIVVDAKTTGDSQTRVARRHGVAQRSVSRILRQNPDLVAQVISERNKEIADLAYGRIKEALAQLTDKKLIDANALSLAKSIGILDDHYRLATAQPTERSEVAEVTPLELLTELKHYAEVLRGYGLDPAAIAEQVEAAEFGEGAVDADFEMTEEDTE